MPAPEPESQTGESPLMGGAIMGEVPYQGNMGAGNQNKGAYRPSFMAMVIGARV
jgi:hypothetical protein